MQQILIIHHILMWQQYKDFLSVILKILVENCHETFSYLFPMHPFSTPWKYLKTVRRFLSCSLPSWFSLDNSETVKAVTLTFCSIQQLFIRDIHAKFGSPNSSQSPDIGQNSDWGISDFQISGQSCINENRHDSRTSDDIDIKLGPVTKLDKGNTSTSKFQRLFHDGKFCWGHCLFSDLCPICSHAETGFRTHGLWNLNFL